MSLQDGSQAESLRELIRDVPRQPEIVSGDAGILEVASHPDAEAVVTGIVGCAGLAPTCAAISKGKDICLANKETLIAGERRWPETNRAQTTFQDHLLCSTLMDAFYTACGLDMQGA